MGYLFTPEHDVVAMVSLLSWSVILYQFGDGLQILFANALRGIADVKYMAYRGFLLSFRAGFCRSDTSADSSLTGER